MGKFDTHGGYFAPKGYFRVNTGGSHDENPNGGVQVGVDDQGIPNMLEENEPVYDDYVYSDNIKAEESLLKKYNIPEKFAGKLYSEIADAFVDEAEERPNDAISNNGLNAMLVRLADAQEEQKQIKEQKELEEELANMSPEELAELEAMLAQEEEAEAAPVEQEQMMMPMAAGGLLKTFDKGGKKQNWFTRATLSAAMAENPAVMQASGWTYDEDGNVVMGDPESPGAKELRKNLAVIGLTGLGTMGAGLASGVTVAPAKGIVGHALRSVVNPFHIGKEIAKGTAAAGWSPWLRIPTIAVGGAAGTLPSTGAITGIVEGVNAAQNAWRSPWAEEQVYTGDDQPDIDFGDWDYACGGKMHKYDTGGWADFLNRLNGYTVSRKPGRVSGRYGYGQFPLGQYATARDLENSDAYKAFTDYVLNNANNENVQNYLKALDAGTAAGVAKLYNADGTLNEGWQDLFRNRRTDGLAGIYHFSGENPDAIMRMTRSTEPLAKIAADDTLLKNARVQGPKAELATRTAGTPNPPKSGKATPLPTFPRYAGAITSALTGLYDVFQEPDEYRLPHYTPTLPTGRMDLIDPVFNPIDENMAVNDVLASSSGTVRGLQNSGLGPSTAAALLAADYNAGRNIGNARTQVWDANNQRRNQIIAQRNANGQALGQFHYGINRDRAQILNDAALRNMQNDLLLQRLNYAAEGEKYAAIQSQLDQVGQALSGIGQENFAMNQANSIADYKVLPNGQVVYSPRSAENGGILLRTYKKK